MRRSSVWLCYCTAGLRPSAINLLPLTWVGKLAENWKQNPYSISFGFLCPCKQKERQVLKLGVLIDFRLTKKYFSNFDAPHNQTSE